MNWEFEWIDNNIHRYTSKEHAEAVKRNIEKRYLINQLQNKIKDLEKELDRYTMCGLDYKHN